MRMFAQDKSFYRTLRVDETTCPVAVERRRILEGVDLMRKRFTAAEATKAFGVSLSTYYDWKKLPLNGGVKALVPRSSRPLTHPGKRWTHADALRVFAIRERMRWRGKARLHLEHNARHPDRPLSAATVGRIVRWGLAIGRIKPCAFWCEGRVQAKRRRSFAGGHAERWRAADKHVGIQVDHMTLSIDGRVFKEFRAVCPETRRQHAQAFSRATSGVGKAFLAEALKRLGEKAVQVDGGSEFMGAFEAECARRNLPLKVLPPRRPQLNGIVERANRTARAECWRFYGGELNCAAMNEALSRYLDYCNNRRPHRSLGMKTPAEFARMTEVAA